MVTDSQYRELVQKVKDLENKVDSLSREISRLIFKNDSFPVNTVNTQTSKKDTTKYLFDGSIYCKRRIAYACVKKYITENNVSTFAEAISVFPDYLQGSLGVIKPIEVAEKYSNANSRFYFGDNDILVFEGKRYVICAQWEKNNIDRILGIASQLGYQIQAIETKK